MKHRFSALVFSYVILFSSCGQKYDEVEVKNFVLGTSSNDEETKELLSELTKEFNDEAGFTALTFEFDRSKANSNIEIVSDLYIKTGKIGFSQSVTNEVEEFDPMDSATGKSQKRTVYYTMSLELDGAFINDRILKPDDKTAHYDLQKLYWHEIGHGLTFGHDDNDENSLMYPVIDGNKDMSAFFRRVRAFFGINN